ncbi:MAG: nickel pincer cofactor biosynthesis protein LarC [Nitrospirota bacterium]
MKIAYFDCFSGISGDMCLGAVVDAGAPVNEIKRRLKKLDVKGYSLTEKKVKRGSISATKIDIILRAEERREKLKGKKWKDIQQIIKTSALPEDIKHKGYEVFKNIFDAESKVHGEAINQVHLHDLSGIDSMIDIFGTLTGLSLLGVETIYSSPVNLGGGVVDTAHGVLPVPAPATAEILKDVPVYSSGNSSELTTPTGAAIIKTLSKNFGGMPVLIPENIGIGAGSREIENRPNILRIFIGSHYKKGSDETVTVIETNVDDMNPQIYDYLIEKLLQKGALDVYITQVMMKKTRPGIKLSILCDKHMADDLISLLFKETTTIGVRYYETNRVTMMREIKYVKTKYGKIRVKYSVSGNSVSKSSPEYEDCKRIAKEKGIPLINVIEEVRKASGTKTGD